MADSVFNVAKQFNGAWGDVTDLRILLYKDGATPNVDNATITAVLGVVTECDFTNYARQPLAGEAITVDNTNDLAKLDATDAIYYLAAAGGATNNTIGGAVIYDHGGGTDGTSIPVAFYETNFAITTNGGELTINANASGLATVT